MSGRSSMFGILRRLWPSRRSSRLALAILVVGLGLHVLAFWLVRVETVQVLEPGVPPAYLEVLPERREGDALAEQAALRDSKPLFMPTRLNVAASMDQVAGLREQTELYTAFVPSVRLSAEPLHRPVRAPAPAATLAQNLAAQPLSWWDAFGSRDLPGTALRARAGVVELHRMDYPAPVRVLDLPENLPGWEVEGLWAPLTAYIEVETLGARGLPFIVASTGDVTRDEAIKAYLASEAFTRTLSPGYFRVLVGP